MRRVARIVTIVLLMSAVAVSAPGGNGKGNNSNPGKGHAYGKKRQSRSQNGSYTARVAGYFTGLGTAEVGDESVSLRVGLTAPGGISGELRAENLAINGPYFSGTGTAIGKAVVIRGRLDAAKASRLVATFRSSDGRLGRLVATLPGEVGDEHWDD